jgi:outer membrane scaffolding protein for murein synthesis (MipA/OmpV family)
MLKRCICCLMVGFIAWPCVARGEESLPLLELGVGAGLLSLPSYRGSDDRTLHLLPIPYVVYRGDFLRADGRSLKAIFFESERVELNLSLDATPPVRDDESGAREGMPELDPTVEIGPNLRFRFAEGSGAGGDWRLEGNLALRYVVATDLVHYSGTGWTVYPNLNVNYREKGEGLAKGLNVGLSAGPLFATAPYHDYFYEVAPEYARPGRAAFSPRGGYSGFRATGAISKRFGDFWLGAFFRADQLSGAAFEDSPLVERKTSYMGGIGLVWIFYRSEKKVRGKD